MKQYITSRTESNTIHKLRKLAGIMALVWMCVIFGFSAQTKEESSQVSEGVSYRLVHSTGSFFHLHLSEAQLKELADSIENFVRKGAHMTEYAILAILIFVWIGQWELTRLRRCLIAFFASVLYACSDETHQLFVAGRAGRFTDVMIDSAGALLGLAFFLVVCRVVRHCRTYRGRTEKQQDGSVS